MRAQRARSNPDGWPPVDASHVAGTIAATMLAKALERLGRRGGTAATRRGGLELPIADFAWHRRLMLGIALFYGKYSVLPGRQHE